MNRARLPMMLIRPFAGVALALALAVGIEAPPAAAEEEACKIAVKGDSVVAKACQKNGIRGAKQAMKVLSRAAKEKGMNTECNDCHAGADEWKLNRGAEEKFRRMVELTK